MAAQPIVRESYKFPLETFKTNVIGTANILEAAKHVDTVKAIINVTTDKCYEIRKQENHMSKQIDWEDMIHTQVVKLAQN